MVGAFHGLSLRAVSLFSALQVMLDDIGTCLRHLSVGARTRSFPNQWLSAPAPARLQGYGLREVKPRMALPAVEAPAFLPPPFASSTPWQLADCMEEGLLSDAREAQLTAWRAVLRGKIPTPAGASICDWPMLRAGPGPPKLSFSVLFFQSFDRSFSSPVRARPSSR